MFSGIKLHLLCSIQNLFIVNFFLKQYETDSKLLIICIKIFKVF